MLKKIFLVLLLLFLIAQFIRPSLNAGEAFGPGDIAHTVNVPDSTQLLLKTACYDCHSNHTRYPWYSRITPVNWWLANHVNEGKRELNFTEFAAYSSRRKMKKLEEVAETVEKHEMPLDSYLWIHDEARLTDAQRKALINWANAAKAQVLQDSMAGKK